MRRNATIKANDGNGHKIEVTIKFESKNGLMKHEVNQVVRETARSVAATLPSIRWTDFGAENMKVKA